MMSHTSPQNRLSACIQRALISSNANMSHYRERESIMPNKGKKIIVSINVVFDLMTKKKEPTVFNLTVWISLPHS